MRKTIVALLPLLALTGCGGGGGAVQSISAPPVTSNDPNSTGTATTTGSGTTTTTGTTGTTTGSGTTGNNTTGSGIAGSTTNGGTTQANLYDVTSAVTFNVLAALHSRTTDDNGGELYQGNAAVTTAPNGTITYDPRDGIFHLVLNDSAAGIKRDLTFQDPLHHTTAYPNRADAQAPQLANFNYLEVFDTDADFNLFYQRPSAGSFVTLAGFERYHHEDAPSKASTSEQGVMVFGNRASITETPTSGTAHFDGGFLATMIGQTGIKAPVQQWVTGTSAVDVDFAKRSIALTVAGTVNPAYVDNTPASDTTLGIPSGSTFNAVGTASWGTTNNAFSGKFSSASFTSSTGAVTSVDMSPVSAGGQNTGASSIDGTFYGPGGTNIGGDIRITGGVPNQRVDILGAFVGVKK